MIEWTDEAIAAALTEFHRDFFGEDKDAMRAALDAAVKAQGLTDSRLYKDGYPYAKGRAEALEEAAKAIGETMRDWQNSLGGVGPEFENASWFCALTEARARIRALKEPAKG